MSFGRFLYSVYMAINILTVRVVMLGYSQLQLVTGSLEG